MYPLNIFSLFPQFPRNNKVFIAMSFDESFNKRWNDVMNKVIREIRVNDEPLEPYSVDTRKVSDSILTEIEQGIAECRLFFADMSTIGYLDEKPIRNGNVMYEIGLAQAVRLPEEVILFRSDNDHILFDLANIRVHNYNPDKEPEAAKQQIVEVIKAAFHEIDLQKHISVRRAAESLDYNSFMVLFTSLTGELKHPTTKTIVEYLSKRDQINALSRLLELDLIRTQYIQLTPEILNKSTQSDDLLRYKITPFGDAVLKAIVNRMGMMKPEIQAVLENKFVKKENKDEEDN